MSLRDQLLKSGLVSKERAEAVERSQKNVKHKAHKDKNIRQQVDSEKKQRQDELKAYDEAKKQLDLEKNKEIQLKKVKKEARLEARRIIDDKRVNIKDAELRYNFSSDGKKIRYVRVSEKQREALGKGELAICRNDRDGFDYPIIPKEHALRLLEIEKIEGGRWVYLLIDPNEVSEDNEEWAAWDAYEASLTE